MNKAKAAVNDFLHKSGKHDTTVEEKVAPAVTHENVTKTRHENVNTAVDREVHQDHYHTTVQPVHDKEVLPEKHHHNVAPTDHREIRHGDHDATRARHEQELGQFKDTTTQGQTQHTQSSQPTVAGEHRHHHVHEVVQPVIQKETIQPSVVHTTVPVHETHHMDAKHHNATTLPPVTMEEFKGTGGGLTGKTHHHDQFAGEPNQAGFGSGIGSHSSGTHTPNDHYTTGTHASGAKPGLMSKLNPKVDADGDGKKGFMD